MSGKNSLWGAPRIHGELLKLGFEIAQSSAAKYMVKRRGPPSQGWRTFLRNHPDGAKVGGERAHEAPSGSYHQADARRYDSEFGLSSFVQGIVVSKNNVIAFGSLGGRPSLSSDHCRCESGRANRSGSSCGRQERLDAAFDRVRRVA